MRKKINEAKSHRMNRMSGLGNSSPNKESGNEFVSAMSLHAEPWTGWIGDHRLLGNKS